MIMLRSWNANRKLRTASSCLAMAVLAVCCCSCQSGLNSVAPRGEVLGESAKPQAMSMPQGSGAAQGGAAAHAYSQPQVGCPCCSGESDYGKFSEAYDRKHP